MDKGAILCLLYLGNLISNAVVDRETSLEYIIQGIDGVIKDLPSEMIWLMTSHVFMKQIKLFIYGE